MKVLFVCRGNVGRSQMAAALYNKVATTSHAASAGTQVEKPGQTLLERRREHPGHSFVVDVMQDIGIDVRNNTSTQLTKGMLQDYDLVISMAGKRYTPIWLSEAPNYVYWKVTDPMGRSYEATAHAKDVVEEKVKELITEEREP